MISGSKCVQVKGFMLLSQPKPGKHRPAKPCGRTKVHIFSGGTEIFYTWFREKGRNPGDFYRKKVNTGQKCDGQRGGRHGGPKEKVRAGFYIEKEMLKMADSLLPAANVRSRNEFVTEALKFYYGYLNSGKA